MKKIISVILSASMIAAYAAVPAMADYAAAGYDIPNITLTFGDGTAVNAIDRSPALQAGDALQNIFYDTSINSTQEFYLGFDFCLDNENAYIEIPKYKSDMSSKDKVGPMITRSDAGQLQTQTGGSSYQSLGAVEVNTWYSAEIEGRTGMGAQFTVFRLYSYEDGQKTLVQETTDFNMRNLSSDSRSFNGMGVHDVSLDNVVLVSEKPDAIILSSEADEVNAGATLAFDYVMTRLDTETTKYPVTWSVYDEDNAEPLAGDGIKISENGILSASIDTPNTVVTVRASAAFGEKELYGSKTVNIKAVDVSGEKFDTIIVSGEGTIKAGKSQSYTFTASKDGKDVTADITADDVEWGIYDANGLEKNDNINIKAENGVLTVSDSVLPQGITLRASSKSGTVYGSLPITIDWSENQVETVVTSSACETVLDNTEFITSWDGSKAYKVMDTVDFTFGNQSDYTVTELDIKFSDTEGCGLTLWRNDGAKENTNIRYHSGYIGQQTSSSNWDPIVQGDDFDIDAWYHAEILYLNGKESGYNIYKYNGTEKELVAVKRDVGRRNDTAYGKLRLTAGTSIDNLKITVAKPDNIKLTAPGEYMFAGSTAQFSVAATRYGLTLADYSGFNWEVLDSDKLPILDGSVTISDTGLVTADAMAAAQTLTVRASVSDTISATAEIILQSREIFKVTNLGVNEAGNKVVRVYLEKNFYYNDDVAVILTVRGEDGRLKALKVIRTFGDRLNIGSNELSLDFDLPEDFDSSKDSAEAMVWTSL